MALVHSGKRILGSEQTDFLAADSVVAVVQADPRFQTSCFPAAAGSAVVAVGSWKRLSCQRDPLLVGEAAAGFGTDHHPAVAGAVE